MFHFIHLALPLHRYYIAPKLGLASPQLYKLVKIACRDIGGHILQNTFSMLSRVRLHTFQKSLEQDQKLQNQGNPTVSRLAIAIREKSYGAL